MPRQLITYFMGIIAPERGGAPVVQG